MADRLKDALSPYLRSHAANPVDWFPWSDEAFAEARRRDVPVLVSIGYSTCHWCHVMSRESFSDPVIAARLKLGFVAIKVDREEHPDVDASFLAAAGAFTGNLGWPLNVFVTPEGKTFYAGTYWPPIAVGGLPSFGQVLDAVTDAWTARRSEVEQTASAVVDALRRSADRFSTPAVDSARPGDSPVADLPDSELPVVQMLDAAVAELATYEDGEFGGFGGAPKFPVAPVLLFLLERAATGDRPVLELATRALSAISGRDQPREHSVAALRDRVDGGFFRYATKRDWSDPHYERMLYDNAQLLVAFTRLAQLDPHSSQAAREVAEGISKFLIEVMQQPEGGFASAQDSESAVDGVRLEGAYFALDAAARGAQDPPALDAKVLTGWNGLAIGALATAGFVFSRDAWITAARRAADALIERHLRVDGTLVRTSLAGRISLAHATLEDYGMLAAGLLDLAIATGEARYAVVARSLVDRSLVDRSLVDRSLVDRALVDPALVDPERAFEGETFVVPGGADPVLLSLGIALENDPSEGAYPSGLSSLARACTSLYLITGHLGYRQASKRVIHQLMPVAAPRPVSFGATLAVASALAQPIEQLVVVSDDPHSPLAAVARSLFHSGAISTVLTPAQAAAFADAGFELFEGRQKEAAYLCRNFVCRVPIHDASELAEALGQRG